VAEAATVHYPPLAGHQLSTAVATFRFCPKRVTQFLSLLSS
jgi:hypothetical protein